MYDRPLLGVRPPHVLTRHDVLATTMNVYIHEVDDGLGDADIWDDILPPPLS